MTAILTELYDLAPSLTSSDAAVMARQERFIVRAARRVNEDGGDGSTWDSYNTAVAYLAWHLLLASGQDGSGDEGRGQLLEEKTDNASVKYQAVTADNLESSEPGRQYLALQANRIVDPWVI